MKFSAKTKDQIYKILIREWVRISQNDESNKAIIVLGSIWNLRNMPSSDSRFENAYEDILQHYVRNSDWETEYLFRERLNVMGETTDFKRFIETFLEPQYYETSEQLANVSTAVDSELDRDKLRLVVEDFTPSGFPIQKVFAKEEVDQLPAGVKKNNIPFYVEKNIAIKTSDKEYFVLKPNKRWNDYSVVSIFELSYHSGLVNLEIGHTKIIHTVETVTYEQLPDKFLQLSDEFCSLSGDEDFYFVLQKHFNTFGMISILFALQDAAYFPDIQDRYLKNSNFKSSLIRNDDAERMLRELRPKLMGIDLNDLYSFEYRFQPAFTEIPQKISFGFSKKGDLPDRIIAVIGRNGTGKTQLLTALPNSFAKNETDHFYGKIPAFSKIIAVSYSVFDSFNIPKKNATFNYVYCGLKDDDGDLRSSRGLVLAFHRNWKRIDELGRLARWRSVLSNFIDRDILDGFIVASDDADDGYEVSLEGYHSIKSRLSSGQSILLYIITQVVANLRLDSLILYDEPETHLHPNAIAELMNTIYELVEEFDSYCLIATHSPLVIRELFSKNVYVIEREQNSSLIRRIGLESFGENLGVLTDEVFADREIEKQYKTILERLIKKGKSFQEILDMLEFDSVPLSLNARIFIKSMIKRKNEEL